MRVISTAGCDRDIRRLPPVMMTRVLSALAGLSSNPRPPGCLLLHDWRPPTWRIRVGDFRVFYEIDDAAEIVTGVAVRHRTHAYRPEG